MSLTTAMANTIAFDFLMEDLAIALEDQEWFTILSSRLFDSRWCIVEIGIEGLPDKWVLQVYDTLECDPNYTFYSPVQPSESDTGLDELPQPLADLVVFERTDLAIPA